MKVLSTYAALTLCVLLLSARCQVGGNGVVLEEEPLPPAEQTEDGFEATQNAEGDVERDGIQRRLDDEGLFEEWDTDGDGLLDPREFSTNMFELWDTDNDNAIDRGEWNQGQENWFESTYDFDDWDTDKDGYITLEEFDTGVRENNVLDAWNGISEVDADTTDGVMSTADGAVDTAAFCQRLENENVFGDWDTDGDSRIDTDELASKTFDMWDTDNDSLLTESEWQRNQDWFDVIYDYQGWDTDGDDRLNKEEFTTGIRYNDGLSQWAGDADALDRDRFCRALFSAADKNNSGRVEQDEWERLF